MKKYRRVKRPKDWEKSPVRVPTGKPTEWHRDKKRYSRKQKHKKDWGGDD